MDYLLPEKIRNELKRPFGRLVSNLDEITGELKSGYLISVGDKVTENLLERGILPDVCIYDGRTKRVEIPIPESVRDFGVEEIRVKNPAGSLTGDAFKALSKAVASGKKTRIVVEGEEDLLTLAAISRAPKDALVLYGQPDEGAVVIKVDAKIKKRVEKILEEMRSK
ncbi:MAG: DUF359 domain-containing protein [Candidatus Altiarchaeota archaeon]|nr:DUF359 domain-containing protein [Candidatus Altiarchaeota archaeon]